MIEINLFSSHLLFLEFKKNNNLTIAIVIITNTIIFFIFTKAYNGVAVKPPPIIWMQLKTPKPKFRQAMFNFIRKHRLLEKFFTTQMPKYNVSKNCQPYFYNEKPTLYGGRFEPLVIKRYSISSI